MYEQYFGLIERPFSIAPDPQYLYMSRRHKEAMAHLSYGLTQGGCFIVLTGEVGTGKTTLCRNLLSELPGNVDVALILNANINEHELLQSICDELEIDYTNEASQKQLLDAINAHLLATFADNRHTVLIIDEAQILSRDVLEQIRLLTNLETTKSKLLQIILIGQPELNDVLSRNDLRQLAQRVTARYHLGAVDNTEIEDYVNFRLSVAGCKRPLFSRQALNKLHSLTDGIPRKINVLADHALLAAYADGARLVDAKTVKGASSDVFVTRKSSERSPWWMRIPQKWVVVGMLLVLVNLLAWAFFTRDKADQGAGASGQVIQQPTELGTETQRRATDTTINLDSQVRPGKVIVADQPLDDSPSLPPELAREFNTDSPEPTQAPQGDSPGTSARDPLLSGGGRVSSDALLAAPTDLTLLLETSADKSSRISAFRKLADLWDASLPDTVIDPVCSSLREQGLFCLGFRNWQQWQRYNRPAVLVVEHDNQLHRVLVTELIDDQATIQIGDTTLQVTAGELEQVWVGRGVILWRANAFGAPFLTLGANGSAVVGARALLSQALSSVNLPGLVNLESEDFDLDFSQKLFALQTRFQILNDGELGNESWLLINELNNPEATRVLRKRP